MTVADTSDVSDEGGEDILWDSTSEDDGQDQYHGDTNYDDDDDEGQSPAPDDGDDDSIIDLFNNCQSMVCGSTDDGQHGTLFLQAKNGQCSFYKNCLEKLIPCGRSGWALDIGRPSCLGYMMFRDEFDDEYVS